MKILFKLFAISGAALACEDGIHAHETQCDTFYQCNAGHRYEDQKCPEGLLYNAEAKYCDWPENVECGADPTAWECYKDCVGDKWWSMITATKCSKNCYGWNMKQVSEINSVAAMDAEYCATGIYPHATKCDAFYQCWEGVKTEDQNCPDGLMYNPAGYCDWSENVICPEVPVEKPEKCQKGDLRANETDCKKFYECSYFGLEIPRKCGFMMIFNTKTQECDYEYKPWVKCSL